MKLLVKREAEGISVGIDGTVWLSEALPRLHWRIVGTADWVESTGEIIGTAKSEEGRIEICSSGELAGKHAALGGCVCERNWGAKDSGADDRLLLVV